MQVNKVFHFQFLIVVLLVSALACSGGGAVVPESTETPLPTSTNTPKPTATPRPTKTPNLVATRQHEEFQSLLQTFEENGYIESTDGSIVELDPFKESWAQINWYQWWTLTETDGDFVFEGHLEWTTASSTPEDSGCGIVFGVQDNNDHYAVFLANSRIVFLMARGTYSYEVGKTQGSGRANFDNPAEADFAVAAKGQSAYVSVNGDVTQYTLSADQTTEGDIGLSLLSGTNRDYGTRCEMTDMMLWRAK